MSAKPLPAVDLGGSQLRARTFDAGGRLPAKVVRERLAQAVHPISLRPEQVLASRVGDEIGLRGARALGQDGAGRGGTAARPTLPRPPGADPYGGAR